MNEGRESGSVCICLSKGSDKWRMRECQGERAIYKCMHDEGFCIDVLGDV